MKNSGRLLLWHENLVAMNGGRGVLTRTAILSHLGILLRDADLNSAGWKENLRPDISIIKLSGTSWYHGSWGKMHFYF